ncbi:hypothetical protein WH52_12160 [Tenacibaculum holothuriorum]|uniref:TonB-dependent receptor plug domain-containing protein n=1 Tax=Tenacibaculum holothuriorum TaxID=1635173 RepID=A0A1Y2PB27_9FLAO|nr:hypothetical protein [Tenacibaculum holothuriorum]OSY87211.1 hypothetical protein WH52_12160 [Tenacibaculum holothuriorum]
MKKIITTSIIFMLSFTAVFSQNWLDSINKKYVNYHKLAKEQFVFQFNKTSFFPGEEAWFSCFVLDDKTKRLFKKTKKGTLFIYNANGKLIKSFFLKFEDGVVHSYIKIPYDYGFKKIYFKIETNWSKNFKEKEIRELKVLQGFYELDEIVKPEKKVELYYESNSLVNNIINVLWVKVIQGKKQQKYRGVIKNSKKEEVSFFKTDNLGIGKIYLKPQKGESYYVEIENKGFNKIKIKKSIEKGVVFNLIERNNICHLMFRSNTTDLKKDSYSYLIHQNGHIYYSNKIIFKDNKRNNWFHKDSVGKGLITISLFKRDSLIAERSFYNKPKLVLKPVTLIKKRINKDSINFTLHKFHKDSLLNLSISILPYEKKRKFEDGLLNNKKYFNNFPEGFREGDVVFEKKNIYPWNEILLGKKSTIKKFFEKGFTVKGKLFNRRSGVLLKNYVFGYYTEKGNILMTETDSSGFFKIYNLSFYKGDSLKLFFNNKKDVRIKILNDFYKKGALKIRKNKISKSKGGTFIFGNKNEILDEVKVKGRLIKEKKIDDEFISPVDRTSFVKNFEINSENVNDFKSVLDYLDSQSGVLVKSAQGMIRIFSSRAHNTSLTHEGIPMNVYINNDRLNGLELTYLEYIDINSVKRISINKSGIGRGGNDPYGAISIYLNTKYIKPKIKNKIVEKKNKPYYIFKNLGYKKEPMFFMPNYTFFPGESLFNKYGVLHWEPGVKLDSSSYSFKASIPKTIKKYVVLIKGVSNNGNIIDVKKIIEEY